MSRWEKIQLGDICLKANRLEAPVMGQPYRQLGVRLWGEGAYERETIDGGDTKYAFLNRIEADDLVVNKIWARNGSIAVANPNQAGTYVSAEFPTYQLDITRIEPRWMRLITKWRGFWTACDEKAQGTSGKNRIKPEQFLSIQIPLPALAEQQTIVSRLDQLANKVRQVNEHLDAIDTVAEALLISLHHKFAAGRLVRLGDIIELFEESEAIKPDGQYPQVGVRGFGGGLFAKPALAGTETSYRGFNRLYVDAIVLSQVKGWEGALAVCPPELAGMFVSPEYRTFRCKSNLASPAYLGELIRTPWFWSLLQAATRGVGARRERTRPEQFLNIELPMPELHEQLKIVEILSRQNELKQRHAKIREANQALIPATLERIFQRSTC
ncbi:MAG: restriction endonuclease subunit S [Proteobacteria bacterium ST_bin11]|nr:MAG: restriction endonuclease subunit S [Proteobacteria bacterium ST_bin11]